MDRASDRVSAATVNNQISVMASNVNIPQSQVNQQISNVSPSTASLTKAQVNQQIKSINNGR